MSKHTKTIQVRYPSEFAPHGALYSVHSYNDKVEGAKEQAEKDAEKSKKELAASFKKNGQTKLVSKIEIISN